MISATIFAHFHMINPFHAPFFASYRASEKVSVIINFLRKSL